MFVDIGYIGSKGTRLTEGFDGNRPIQVVVPGAGVPSVSSRRPYKGYDAMSVYKSMGNSTYHSLQTKVERRVGGGLSVLGAYTFSKSLSSADISSVGGGAYIAGIQDYFNLAADKAPSVFDIRHRFSLAAIYDIPVFTHASNAAVRMCWAGGSLDDHHRAVRLRGGDGRIGRHHRNGHRFPPFHCAGPNRHRGQSKPRQVV